MKVTPLVASRRYWCARCGAFAAAPPEDPMCLCNHFVPAREPYLFPIGVEIHGNVELGQGVSICEPADINGTASSILIGDHCDIAAFATVNCADSHRKCIGLADTIERRPIVIENHVFIGQGATILGGCRIGAHSVIGAGVVLKGAVIPPWSRITQGAMMLEPRFYDRASS